MRMDWVSGHVAIIGGGYEGGAMDCCVGDIGLQKMV